VTVLAGHGIQVTLPAGLEGRIYRHAEAHGDVTLPVGHFGSFPVPRDAADYGNGAVERMRTHDVFVVLLEQGSESADTRLYAGNVLPRSLEASDFKPYRLRQGITGHSGAQHFFVEAGRAFSLYAVLGSHLRRRWLLPPLNALLSSIVVDPVPSTVTP
jgi:hypothetical protein